MPIIIKLTSFNYAKPIYVNAANIKCYAPNEGGKSFTLVQFGETYMECVKETPEEIEKCINEKKAELIAEFAKALQAFAEGRKS